MCKATFRTGAIHFAPLMRDPDELGIIVDSAKNVLAGMLAGHKSGDNGR